ncbi:MAG: NAD(P)H-quinone oxidoreductase [Anaerolineae bacterium]
MNGIIVKSENGQPQLVWAEVPDVDMGDDQVLVNVRATAVNRADLMQATGNYPPPLGESEILGLEMAGEIAAIGAKVTGWQVGDRVCALLAGGGYAEQVVVDPQMLIRIPTDWTFAMAAAVPEVWLTAFLNMFIEAELQAGESFLVHAGGSGVGTAAIQLAKAANVTVYATAGTEAKLAACRDLGATLAINYKSQDFAEEILKVADGVDAILCPVGADNFERNVSLLNRRGRYVSIGLLSGVNAKINLAQLLLKRLRLIGSTLRSRPMAEKIAITQQFSDRFWPHFLAGDLKPIVDTTFDIERAQDAHAYIAANKNTGKVVLTIGS